VEKEDKVNFSPIKKKKQDKTDMICSNIFWGNNDATLIPIT